MMKTTAMKKILIIGGGFAGVWSALGAMRLRRMHNKEGDIEISLINRDNYHGIRPRYYEEDLSEVRMPLDKILSPIGVKQIIGEVIKIDHAKQKVHLSTCYAARPYRRSQCNS